MKRSYLTNSLVPTIILVLLPTLVNNVYAGNELVLVTGHDTQLEPLPPGQIRRAFLGLSVMQGSTRIIPIRNMSDDSLNGAFLQNTVFMSEKKYERYLVNRVFKSGGIRPKTVKAEKQLTQALQKPGTVSYMWKKEAESHPNVKIIQSLWQNSAR